jgi:uncharacterized repeat protein (TIGR01451 family)
MTTQLKKSLLIGVSIFLTLVLGIAVVYVVRKPTVKTPTPTLTPRPTTEEKPVTPEIFAVDPAQSVCSTTFVVACASLSPSPSPSGSVNPSLSPSPSPSQLPSAALDCVSKEVYANDSRNRAGFYYLENRIADASTLESGTTIVYNIKVKNNGGSSVPDTKITDVLSSNLTFVDADSDCTYESSTRVLTCTIGTLAAGAQAQRTFRATINSSSNSSIANTAEVYSTNGQRDSCSVALSATGKVVTPTQSVAPSALPQAGVFEVTVGTMGIGLLLLILGGMGLLMI